MGHEIPKDLILKLQEAKRVAVLTGAGASAESGVATFRDAQTGLWAKYRPEDLATPQAFQKNPRRIWEWYTWRRSKLDKVEPNQGHFALANLESQLKTRNAEFVLVTQNVDGLHRKAGSQHVVELHGNIQLTKCSLCGKVTETWHQGETLPPTCPLDNCGGLLRPDVVWFGESLPMDALQSAIYAAQHCDLFFSVGTSALVQPAASLPLIALESNATVVEINPNPTPITNRVTYVLSGNSGKILPKLIAAAWD
jgi:NAD-dependent deacetylase